MENKVYDVRSSIDRQAAIRDLVQKLGVVELEHLRAMDIKMRFPTANFVSGKLLVVK